MEDNLLVKQNAGPLAAAGVAVPIFDLVAGVRFKSPGPTLVVYNVAVCAQIIVDPVQRSIQTHSRDAAPGPRLFKEAELGGKWQHF